MSTASSSSLEWQLISGDQPSSTSASASAAERIVSDVLNGEYASAFACQAVQTLLQPLAKRFAKSLAQHPAEATLDFTLPASPATQTHDDKLSVLAASVAALHAFVRLNWTGPELSEADSSPAALLRRVASDAFPLRSASSDDDEQAEGVALNRAALDSLTRAGEPAYHLARSPAWLGLAICLVEAAATMQEPLESAAWWRLRTESVHARVLDVHVPPEKAVFDGVARLVSTLAERSASAEAWSSLHARLVLERGLAEQRAGNDRQAVKTFLRATQLNGLRYEVTGAPGRKTKWQKEDKNILVLLAESAPGKRDVGASDVPLSSVEEGQQEGKAAEPAAEEKRERKVESGWKTTIDEAQPEDMPATLLLNDDTLLERTKFTSTAVAGETSSSLAGVDPSNPTPLAPLDSCILLALSLDLRNTSPEHGLLASQIGVFVTRVLAHARNWSVHTMALLLRSRLEATRTRTAERGVLQLQALLDQMPTTDSTTNERLRFFHSLELPSTWEIKAELAKRYAALGVIRSALEIFEQIELWEEVVACLGALGRAEEGRAVVRDLIEGRKVESEQAVVQRKRGEAAYAPATSGKLNAAREAKLWCLLGDLEPQDALQHYQKGWDVSSASSSRAARSLGGFHFAREEYDSSATWLRRSLRLTPLYTRSWFMLGCALMRTERFVEAAAAFRRAASLDEEDAESWNNLASCYLSMGADPAGTQAGLAAAQGLGGVDSNDRRIGLGADGAELGDSDDDDSSTVVSVGGTDSGVSMDSTDDEEDDAPRLTSRTTPYELRLLAHRALGRALRYSHDNWRVWSNYMAVSLDAGFLSEAARSFSRVIELRVSARDGGSTAQEVVDLDVLRRLVDGVTRAPSDEELQEGTIRNPDEGHGLAPAVERLFTKTLLPRITPWPSLLQTYAKLLLWKGDLRGALEAHLSAWTAGAGDSASDAITTDLEAFRNGVVQLKELVEMLENLGPRDTLVTAPDGTQTKEVAMPNWAFKARSAVRMYMGRTRQTFEDDARWADLEELRDELKSTQ